MTRKRTWAVWMAAWVFVASAWAADWPNEVVAVASFAPFADVNSDVNAFIAGCLRGTPMTYRTDMLDVIPAKALSDAHGVHFIFSEYKNGVVRDAALVRFSPEAAAIMAGETGTWAEEGVPSYTWTREGPKLGRWQLEDPNANGIGCYLYDHGDGWWSASALRKGYDDHAVAAVRTGTIEQAEMLGGWRPAAHPENLTLRVTARPARMAARLGEAWGGALDALAAAPEEVRPEGLPEQARQALDMRQRFLKVLPELYRAGALPVLEQVEEVRFDTRLDADGWRMRLFATPVAGTTAAEWFAAERGTGFPLLARLPRDASMAAAARDVAEAPEAFVDGVSLVTRLLARALLDDEELEDVTAELVTRALARGVTETAAAVTGAPDDPAALAVLYYQRSRDAEALRKEQAADAAAGAAFANRLYALLGVPAELAMTVEPDAGEAGGVAYDRMKVDLTVKEGAGMPPEMAAAIKHSMENNPLAAGTAFGAVGDVLVTAQGKDPAAAFGRAAEALKADGYEGFMADPANAGVVGNLPGVPSLVAVMYARDFLGAYMGAMLPGMGLPDPVVAAIRRVVAAEPKGKAPLTLAASFRAGRGEMEILVPTAGVSEVILTGMKAGMAAQMAARQAVRERPPAEPMPGGAVDNFEEETF